MRSSAIKQIALVGVLFLLGAVLIVLRVPPAGQYEISLYEAYPTYFWVLVVGALFFGAVVIVASALESDDGNWMFGFSLMAVTNVMVLLMPFIRGYRMYGRGDALTHIGFVRDILSVGLLENNIYPPIHLLVAVLADATGLELTTVGMALPAVFSVVYFGSMFYLLVFLFDSRERVLFGIPFTILPVLGFAHANLRPFDASILFAPLVLYLFVKGRQGSAMSVRAVFVIALVANLLYHPLTAIFVIALVVLYFVGRHLPKIQNQFKTPTNVVSLSVVVFVAWYTNFRGVIRRFDILYQRLFGFAEGTPPIQQYSQTVSRADIALIDFARVFTIKFGTEFLLFGLGFAFLGVALVLYYRGAYTPTPYTILFGGALAVFGIGGLGFLLSDLLVSQERPFQIAKICAAVLAGQLFYILWDTVDWNRRWTGLHTGFFVSLVIVLLLLTTVATFSLYPSPLGSEYNHQVTQMELSGTAWLTERAANTTQFNEFGIIYRRFHHAQYGFSKPRSHVSITIPSHFGYGDDEFVGQSYEEDVYLMIPRRGRVLYPELFPDYRENWRFTPGDFARLERDPTTARIYDNGNFNVYWVNGTAGEGVAAR